MNAQTLVVKILSIVAVLTVVVALGISAVKPDWGRPPGMNKVLTGVISDSLCGESHSMSGESDAECTRLCIKVGCAYALVVGKNIYTLEGHEPQLNLFAGRRVTVKGTVNGNTFTVKSVAPVNSAIVVTEAAQP